MPSVTRINETPALAKTTDRSCSDYNVNKGLKLREF